MKESKRIELSRSKLRRLTMVLLCSRGAADYNHLGVLIYARGAWPRLNDGVFSGYARMPSKLDV
jgi:hypothetical protein